jgi:hypothetical protein
VDKFCLDLRQNMTKLSSTSKPVLSNQLMLFSDAPSEDETKRQSVVLPRAPSRQRKSTVRMLTEADMPHYADPAIEAAAQCLRQLPPAQLWFTYKDIQFFFGVSRATVARRLRERLVPGVIVDGDHVVEDAAVRRFDRTQLRWLLLAVRYRPRSRSV